MGNIKMVIGSWGSYNAGNKRALGSKWLDLSDYSDWDEIVEELEKEGFELDGIDEELFIQDIDGLPDIDDGNHTHPQKLFEVCKEAGIIDDDYKYEVATAYLEVRYWKDFEDLVDKHGEDWDADIYLYKNQSIEEVMENLVEEYYNLDFSKLGWISNYITIDYKAMARDAEGYYEVTNGTLYINR